MSVMICGTFVLISFIVSDFDFENFESPIGQAVEFI